MVTFVFLADAAERPVSFFICEIRVICVQDFPIVPCVPGFKYISRPFLSFLSTKSAASAHKIFPMSLANQNLNTKAALYRTAFVFPLTHRRYLLS